MTTTIDSPASVTISPESFAALPPVNHHEPLQVGKDTYLIRQIFGEGTAPVGVYVNSLVILGREPVIVDTGTVSNRKDWLADVFSLVDPKDVRWIFISHDDHDHVGNLAEALALCPNATLISHWFQVERLAGDYNLPLNRMRWVNDGESFDAGDRLLVAIRPPVFDAPTTRGLYDTKSRIYWAADSFAAPILSPVENVAELDREFWAQGFSMFHSMISPWHTMLDQAKWDKAVDRVAELDLAAIVGGHSPVTSGAQIQEAIAMMRRLPQQEAAPYPGQAQLEEILATMTAPA
jgi:flavorubredoxin